MKQFLTLLPYIDGEEKMLKEDPILLLNRIVITNNLKYYELMFPKSDLFDSIYNRFNRKVLPNNINHIVNNKKFTGFEITNTDYFGARLTYCLAQEFRKVHVECELNESPIVAWNKGAIKMMQNIDPLTPIILYWS
jgi:hypothetical protein